MLIPAWVDGATVAMDKLEVHRRGVRHPAVSVFVLDAAGDVLLQRRALSKYHTPGLWANTCCTHPHWGETAPDCAKRRLQEELGIGGLTLGHAGTVEYRADVGNGLIEHEVVSIFTARAAERPTITPNLAEVAQTRWISPADLQVEIATTPAHFTPWLRIYMTDHCELVLGRAREDGKTPQGS